VTTEVTVFGARYSVYVRAVLMALESKRVEYKLEPIDSKEIPSGYRRIHPFGKIPSLRHDDFTLYETCAINRYVDEAFDGPPLQPKTSAKRARMTQIMSMTDSYGYRPLVWDIYVERVSNPKEGKPSNEERVAAALPKARIYLDALERLMDGQAFLADDRPTLADFHTAPVFGYFVQTPEGRELLGDFPALADWWMHISAREEWMIARGKQ
jgi:glutathione S-transferase